MEASFTHLTMGWSISSSRNSWLTVFISMSVNPHGQGSDRKWINLLNPSLNQGVCVFFS